MNQVKEGETFLLLGDVFDFLIYGPESFKREYELFFKTCEDLHQKRITIHYIEGNHDFHLKEYFRKCPHVHVHSQQVELQIDDKRFFCAHGDLIDTEDYGYLFLRFILRSYFIKILSLFLSEKIILNCKNKLSQNSKGKMISPEKQQRTRTLFRNFAVEKFKENFDFVILGHSHDYDEETFMLHGKSHHYLNVGHPKTHRRAIFYNKNTKSCERVDF